MTDLNIDRNGLELVEHIDPRFPITIIHDEMTKYTNSYIHWHGHPHLEFVLSESVIEIGSSDEQFRLFPGDGAFINAGQLHSFRVAESSEDGSGYAFLFAPEIISSADSLIYEKYLRPLIENTKLPFIMFRKENATHALILEKLKKCIEIYQKDGKCCELACHLLHSTELSIKDIAARCGFDDAGYFGRLFHKRCGLTPASYRAEALQKS